MANKKIATLADSLKLMKSVVEDFEKTTYESAEEKENLYKEIKMKALTAQTITNACNVVARITHDTNSIETAKEVIGDLSETE